MPSYDKKKLLQMLQNKRVGHLATRDLSDRRRSLALAITHARRHIYENAAHVGAQEFLEELLALPLAEAIALPRENVEGFLREVRTRSGVRDERFSSGIGYAAWTELNSLRECEERLDKELDRIHEDMDQRHGIMPKLLEAVREWGFKDPELEM